MSFAQRMQKMKLQEALVRDPVPLGWYRHFRGGGAYVVFSATLDEATGVTQVAYFSALLHYRWSRAREVFFAEVPPDDASGRDVTLPILVPRFTWWRPATREELAAAAFGAPDEIRRVFGDAIAHEPHEKE